MRCEAETLEGGCGVQYANYFDDAYGAYASHIHKLKGGGAGWICAAFNYGTASTRAYEEFKASFKEVFRTPDRLNTNSGNMFYFCIFDATKKPGEE